MATILCVEDNDDNQYMLHRRLTRAGYEVKIAHNGAEGVEWAKTLQPDLIVMDLDLPKVDGFEATRRLKSMPETRHIPIVVLSSHAMQRHHDEAFAAGCDAFETKPTDFGALVSRIESLLRRGSEG